MRGEGFHVSLIYATCVHLTRFQVKRVHARLIISTTILLKNIITLTSFKKIFSIRSSLSFGLDYWFPIRESRFTIIFYFQLLFTFHVLITLLLQCYLIWKSFFLSLQAERYYLNIKKREILKKILKILC